MIRTVKIDIHAENPSFPLQPVEVFEHSAASFTILNVPRAHGKREIGGVTVIVTDVDGVARGVAAVRNGSAWNVTIPETSIGRSGSVANGVMIAANGLDERGAVVPMWILGVGDLTVMRADGSVAPGEVRDTVHFFATAPANPSRGDIAPIEGVLKLFNGDEWMDIGGGSGGFDVVGEIGLGGKTFREGAQNDQAIVHSMKIPRKYFDKLATLSAIKLRGATNDSGTWDKTAKMNIFTSASSIWGTTGVTSVEIGKWASFACAEPEAPFTIDQDSVTIVFAKATGAAANVRIGLVSVPASYGFEIEFQNGSTSNVFAPLMEFHGRVKRDDAIDGNTAILAELGSLRELPNNSTASQILSKVNEIIQIVKGK